MFIPSLHFCFCCVAELSLVLVESLFHFIIPTSGKFFRDLRGGTIHSTKVKIRQVSGKFCPLGGTQLTFHYIGNYACSRTLWTIVFMPRLLSLPSLYSRLG
uniref:Secreted protein n=1 Tax=Mus musculus TaxID=10090 RepID=Q8BQE8_MOUSE|nr:unnamed protein product [Mus musculus]